MSNELRPDEQDELAASIRRAFSSYRAPARSFELSGGRRSSAARSRLVALSATAGLVVVLLAAAVLAQSLARPTSVYATWTAVPMSPDPALAGAADEECRSSMLPAPADAELDRTLWSEEQRQRLGVLGDPADLPLVALDQRGQVALALFSDGRSYADCMVVRSRDRGVIIGGTGAIDGQRSGALRVLSGMAYEGDPRLRMVVGDVSPDVSTVAIRRDDGVEVTATVSNGYFLAWWPSSAGVASITAHNSAGDTLDTLPSDIFD
jgi:hypothetical protein